MTTNHLDIRRQAELVLDWLGTDDSKRTARVLVTRYKLDCDPSDLIQQAWLRVSASFATRIDPLPSIEDSSGAARFGYRVLSNLAIDHLRRDHRRHQLPSYEYETVPGPEDGIVTQSFFEELVRRVAHASVDHGNCGGCSPMMLRSIGIRAVQSMAFEAVLGSPAAGQDPFDEYIDEALGRVTETGRSTRQRKQKSRCKGCVRALLARVVEEMESRRD